MYPSSGDLYSGDGLSTVFLGLDHGICPSAPVVFETMIFNGKHDQEQWRYTTYAAAKHGHREAVALVVETS